MEINLKLHKLLILSKDFKAYQSLVERVNLPGLSILATNEPGLAIQLGSESDLLFGEPSLVSQILNNIPGIRWVQTTWAGVEPLLAEGLRRDYLLSNARDVYGSMMSEYVFGYLLLVERQILPRWQSQQAGKWDDRPYGRLKGKILGLMGVGTIGSHIAATARHFGMRVMGYTRHTESCEYIDQYFHGDAWPVFAADLDYLVCTLPGTTSTQGMLNGAFLAALPKRAWLINVGRGSTVDEPALVAALNNASIAGAILDVFTQEPLPPDHPLWSTPNTFITSHTAARNILPDIASLFIDNYQRYIRGQPLLYQVDFEQGY
jgi:phosphoglycerate dehydrogenase-like enzyme